LQLPAEVRTDLGLGETNDSDRLAVASFFAHVLDLNLQASLLSTSLTVSEIGSLCERCSRRRRQCR
jgi:hypothetical protein